MQRTSEYSDTVPWVYNYPRTSANLIGICRLAQRGFKIKLWETVKVLQYLIEQAPNPMLRQKLKEAIFRTTVALIERDMRTQRLRWRVGYLIFMKFISCSL